ncbi:MAG: TonB-dependent siderophore receptor [Alphaproteobacteria bacterium]
MAAACLAGVAVAAMPAQAQAPDQRVEFAIQPQDLADALIAFAEQTGLRVKFRRSELQGLGTSGLEGEADVRAGLRRLLGGSGLAYHFTADGSVVIGSAVSAPVDNADATAMAEITIEGLRGITSYEPTVGYVSYYSVAATKTDTPVIETPQSVSTIARDEIEAHDAKTVAEAVRYSAGVTVDTYGVDPRGYDSITIRGFDAATTGSFRDGLRMDGNSFAVYATEPYGIERIDIMRGPSGALYGQAEAGGVVDRTTKRPRADMVQEVRLETGSWDHLLGAFDVGGAVDDDHTLLFRLTGLAREADTEYDYDDGTEQSNDRRFIAPALTWAPTADTSLTVLADYLKDDRYLHPGPIAPDGFGRSDVVPGEPGFDRFDQEQYALGYSFAHRFNPTFTFRQNARYSHVEIEYQGVYADALDEDGRTLQRYVWAAPDEIDQIAIDNQLEAKLHVGPTFHTVLAGFDHSISDDDFSYHTAPAAALDLLDVAYSSAEVPDPYQVTEQKLRQTGIYLQDQLVYDDRWILTLGGRYSWVKQDTTDLLADTTERKKDSAFTGRAGLTYLFDNGLAPYASYTEGFVPTEGTDLSGESFEPEESRQYEVGLKYQPPEVNALFTASLFHLTKTNVLRRDPDNINASVQAGEVRVRGVELEAKTSLAAGLQLIAAYGYADAEVTESTEEDLGQRPVTVPAHSAALWLDYDFPEGSLDGVGLGGGVRHVGETYNDLANTSTTGGYTLFDAQVSYALTDDATFEVNANNLFDKEYVTTCAFNACFYGTGRRITAALTLHW